MQARGRLISLLAIVLATAASGLVSLVAPAEAVPPVSGAASRSAASECRRVALSPRPGWVSSGAWMENGTELVVADARSRQVLSFDAQGKGFTARPQKLTRALEDSSPARIIADPAGDLLFAELERERFTVLDSKDAFPIYRKNIRAESLVGDASQGTRSLDKLFLWAPVRTDVLAYASIKEVAPGGQEASSSEFVRFPVEHPDQFQTVVARNRNPSKIFYKLGHPLISSLRDTGYLLFFDNGTPGLYRNEKGSTELLPMGALDALYPRGGGSPVLPTFVRPEDFPAVMRAVERSSMPVGLYGFDGFLYVLFRSPSGGATKWVMSKIDVDPRVDAIVASIDIPTRANHLTVVPGPREWAFIEKGPARGHKDQDVNSVLFVPASRIKGTSAGNPCR